MSVPFRGAAEDRLAIRIPLPVSTGRSPSVRSRSVAGRTCSDGYLRWRDCTPWSVDPGGHDLRRGPSWPPGPGALAAPESLPLAFLRHSSFLSGPLIMAVIS